MSSSLIRYPGGKSKFKQPIINQLKKYLDVSEYREPFFGGGSIGLEILTKYQIENFWINDKDIGIYCLWKAVAEYPCSFKDLVKDFVPSIAEYQRLTQFLNSPPSVITESDVVSIALAKLAIHQMSFSGLGLKAGGPIGGATQSGKYKINCRWSSENICKKIDLYSKYMQSNFKITNIDFEDMILDQSHEALLYLDPPYYQKGSALYIHAFSECDHQRLANALQSNIAHKWVLSYDDCPEIRKLYDWAYIVEFDGIYTIKQIKDEHGFSSNTKKELLIMPLTEQAAIDDVFEEFFVFS